MDRTRREPALLPRPRPDQSQAETLRERTRSSGAPLFFFSVLLGALLPFPSSLFPFLLFHPSSHPHPSLPSSSIPLVHIPHHVWFEAVPQGPPLRRHLPRLRYTLAPLQSSDGDLALSRAINWRRLFSSVLSSDTIPDRQLERAKGRTEG